MTVIMSSTSRRDFLKGTAWMGEIYGDPAKSQ